MLIESLIRLGRPFVEGGAEPLELLRQVSDVMHPKACEFFRRIFVVEIAEKEGAPNVVAHPRASWGHVESHGRSEQFRPDEDRVIGIPFILSRGNPTYSQGYYPVPVYIVYDGDFRSFRSSTEKVKSFLEKRVNENKTVGVCWSDEVLEKISAALAEELGRYLPHQGEDCRSLIVIIDLTDQDSPYVYDGEIGSIPLCESRIWPGRTIYADVDRLLKKIWDAKIAEGKELGSRAGTCSICGTKSELVSIYSRAWSWFSVTWTAPFPYSAKPAQMAEAVAICTSCYASLTVGAQVFSNLAQALPEWLTKESFGPVASARSKQRERIYGSLIALPVLDEFLKDQEERRSFVQSIASMRFSKGSTVQRHLDTITGFEARLPTDLSNDEVYRLHLYYYSHRTGGMKGGDVHLRASIEDIVPSVASSIDTLLLGRVGMEVAEAAKQLNLTLKPEELQRFHSLPYLLATAYGVPYLWSTLADVLHRRPLRLERFITNTSARMRSLARLLPAAYPKLKMEVLFYLAFREFVRAFNEEIVISGAKGRESMRSWQELQAMLACDVQQVRFEDVEELGFACGHLTRQFSRWYYKRTKKDFLRHRVMVFGSDLTPEIIWQRALSKFGEYQAKLWREGTLPRWFERLTGVILVEFSHRRGEIRRQRDAFMATFWAGYSLQSPDNTKEEKVVQSESSVGGRN